MTLKGSTMENDTLGEEPLAQETVALDRWQVSFPLALDSSGEMFIPLRALCGYLGIAPNMQLRRIKEHPVLARHLRNFALMTPTRGKRPTWCISHLVIGFWLGTISVTHVREELRTGLFEFQSDLVAAAHRLLFGDTPAPSWRIMQATVAALQSLVAQLEDRIGHVERITLDPDTDA